MYLEHLEFESWSSMLENNANMETFVTWVKENQFEIESAVFSLKANFRWCGIMEFPFIWQLWFTTYSFDSMKSLIKISW